MRTSIVAIVVGDISLLRKCIYWTTTGVLEKKERTNLVLCLSYPNVLHILSRRVHVLDVRTRGLKPHDVSIGWAHRKSRKISRNKYNFLRYLPILARLVLLLDVTRVAA